MTDSMPALVGGVAPDWELRDVPVPTPGPGQVLVRVHAAGINRADLLMLEGTYNPGAGTRSAYTAGLELAGEVAALGKEVTSLAVGDQIMGATLGTFARYALLDHRHRSTRSQGSARNHTRRSPTPSAPQGTTALLHHRPRRKRRIPCPSRTRSQRTRLH